MVLSSSSIDSSSILAANVCSGSAGAFGGAGVKSSTMFLSFIWVFPKIGKHPKMDGENNGKPY